jgi:hypothetical protein
MGEIHRALMRAQRERGLADGKGTLRTRMRAWMPMGRTMSIEPRADPAPRAETPTPATSNPTQELREEIASLQLSVDALDDRVSAEMVERETKLLEEIRRGMRGLENELSRRFVAAALEIRRTVRLGVAVAVALALGLSGLVVGVLAVV